MKSFTDNAGRTWTISVNIATVKRVHALVGVHLVKDAIGGDLLERLSSDPVLLCDVLFVLVQPEAQKQHVSDEDFGRAMAGDALEGATQALLEELVDFFPQDRRLVLRKALAKHRLVLARLAELADAKIEALDVDETLARMLHAAGGSFGNSPAPLASIPAR